MGEGGGQDGEVTASHSSLRFRCCAAEFPRVTRLTAGGGVGVEVWGWGGQPTDNPVKLPADPLGAYGSVSAHMSAGCRVHNQDSFGAIRG